MRRSAILSLSLFLGLAVATEAHAGTLVTETNGTVVDIAGGGDVSAAPRFATGLDGPRGICIGPNEDIYVTEISSGEVTIITDGGDLSAVEPFAFGLSAPVELLCTESQILVVDFSSGAIHDITLGGNFNAETPFAFGLGGPVGIIRDGLAIYVTQQLTPAIIDVRDGEFVGNVMPFATVESDFRLRSIARGPAGELLVAVTDSSAVLDFSAGGDVTTSTFASGAAIVGLEASDTMVVAADQDGNVYDITAGGDISVLTPLATGVLVNNFFAGILLGICGDGVADLDESCDDAAESATCNADCSAAACGDGIVNVTAGEDCDVRGETSQCDDDCSMVECGDGVRNATAGEECDDGNSDDNDGCSSACEEEPKVGTTSGGSETGGPGGATGEDPGETTTGDETSGATTPMTGATTTTGDTTSTAGNGETADEETGDTDEGTGENSSDGCGCTTKGDPRGSLILLSLLALGVARRRQAIGRPRRGR